MSFLVRENLKASRIGLDLNFTSNQKHLTIMKASEIKKDQMDNRNSLHDPADMRVSECDEECQKRGKRNLVLLSLVFILLFVTGYFIHPGILRNAWLIASGTLAVITGLLLFLVQVRVISLKC